MSSVRASRVAVLVLVLAGLSACASETSSPPPSEPDAADDTSVVSDGGGDTTVETGSDTSADDTSVDSSMADSADTSSADTSVADTSIADTSVADTSIAVEVGDDVAEVSTDASDAMATDANVDAAPSCAPLPAPTVVVNTAGRILLRGTIVTPDTVISPGEVYVEGDTIQCVATSCASAPNAATATVIETHGLIFPGLIDTHNHILFDIFDETDWAPTQSYQNHNQWTNEARYGAMVDTKQYLNGEGSAVDFGCEMNKYGELKALVAGTTSVVGAANSTNRSCYGSLTRTLDQSPNDLGADKMQVATLFPNTTSADGVCNNFTAMTTDAYLIHVGEGVDETSRREFDTLGTVTTTDNCLYNAKTTIVHGTALGDPELSIMATNGMSLVWSPRSNVFLYGAGTDYTKTTKVPLARAKGINVALAPDWSMGGSQNLLDEMRFADALDNAQWGDVLTPKAIVEMVTINAAKAAGLSSVLGSIAVGKKADLMVIVGDPTKPYDSLLKATPREVRLVMVGGVPLYGDVALQAAAPATPGCEVIDVCCGSKFVCVAEAGGTTTNKFGQTLAQIRTALSDALTAYDALNLTQWKFSPITPLVRCP